MPPPAQEVNEAKEAAARILHGLCSRSFAYAVERQAGAWTLRIECATGEGWQAFKLPVDPAELATSLHDARVRRRLTAAWIKRLRACGAQGLRSDE